jgi:MoxR-like ATPase
MTDFKQYIGNPDAHALDRGAEPYIASPELATAVNTAIAAGQPLLVTGAPGTGKSRLAESIADSICATEEHVRRPDSVAKFHVRSDSRARDVLYSYDHMARFYDAQVENSKAAALKPYRKWGALGAALEAASKTGQRSVVLIDEVDKAPTDFPNDLLNALDRWEIDFPETGEDAIRVPEPARPFVLITSNQERPLPQPFLRRCVFHHLELPSEDDLKTMVHLHLRSASKVTGAKIEDTVADLIDAAIQRFIVLRDQRAFEWEKQPSTGELLAWIRVLRSSGDTSSNLKSESYWVKGRDRLGALVKTVEDWRRVVRSFDEVRTASA